MNWEKIEEIIGEPLPNCIKQILSDCAYDTFASLKSISIESCVEIEKHINTNSRKTIQLLDCCHSDYYKKQQEFKLIPGHKDLIVSLSKISSVSEENCDVKPCITNSSKFSCVLKELIETQIGNSGRDCLRYGDIIRWFATYIFLLCGRSCYEMLNHNLPLPSTKTIREYIYTTNI